MLGVCPLHAVLTSPAPRPVCWIVSHEEKQPKVPLPSQAETFLREGAATKELNSVPAVNKL